MAKKRILITGGFGYLGGRAALALAKNRDFTIRLGAHRSSARACPEWVKDNQFEVVNLDVSSEDGLDVACKGVNYVVHLASLNEVDSFIDPQQALLVNTLGTLKLIEACHKFGVERLIYLSTIHIYGTPLFGVITEDAPLRAKHPYAITHQAAEDFVLAASLQKKLSGFILRPANGFGAPADPFINRWKLIVNDLCKQAVTARKLVLRSPGEESRNFITLTDIIRAIEHLLLIPADICGDGIFNVGEKKPTTAFELAQIIAGRCEEVLGYFPSIERPQAQEGRIMQRLDYRSDKLRATGFSLLSNFHEEIDATLRFCEEHFKNVE